MKFSAVTFVFFINFIVLFDDALSGQTLSLVPLEEWEPKILLISESFSEYKWEYIKETLRELQKIGNLVDETIHTITHSHGKVVPEAVKTFIGDPHVMIQQGGTRLSQMSKLCGSWEESNAISEATQVVNIWYDDSRSVATTVVNQGGNNKANHIILGRLFFSPRVPPTEKISTRIPPVAEQLLRDARAYGQAKRAFAADKRAGQISSTAVFTKFPMPLNPVFQLLRAFQYSNVITVHGLLPENDDFTMPQQAASPGVVALHERAMNWALIGLFALMDKRRLRVPPSRIYDPSDFFPIEGLHH